MANVSCSSCEDLRQTAPNLIVNGLGSTECTHLKNNTGVSGNSTDCADLNDMNDCFIGNLEPEIDTYDVCDWKEFMKKMIPNLWTVLKGIICAICGLWTNIDGIWTRLSEICKMLESVLDHPTTYYGVAPNAADSHKGGTIATKDGHPIVVPAARVPGQSDISWEMQCVGILYGKMQSIKCESGACRMYEWIAPYFHWYKFSEDVTPEYGDLIWSVDKETAQSKFGITDYQWAAKEQNAVSWVTDFRVGTQAIVGFRMSVENDRLCIHYTGGVGDTGSALRGQIITEPADGAERLYQHSC